MVYKETYKVVPQFGIAKLVQITPISIYMFYGRYIYSYYGSVFKPTNITGGLHHLVSLVEASPCSLHPTVKAMAISYNWLFLWDEKHIQ